MRDYIQQNTMKKNEMDINETTTTHIKGVLPRYLRYWVNSIPLQSCILYDNRYKIII